MRKRNWLAAVLIYIVIVIYDIVLLVGTPLVHIEVEEEDVTGNYKVISVGDEGWGQAYMKPGDIVTAIDGASPVSNFTVQHYGKIERADSITRLGADGNEQLLTIQKLPLHVSLLSIIGPLSASILFLFFRSRDGALPNERFFGISSGTLLSIHSTSLSRRLYYRSIRTLWTSFFLCILSNGAHSIYSFYE
ncbi:hypothetical protein MKY42_02645 [Paenibacillus sp. FSL W7-1088]|uniref:hypothetical protein n=1 Tax=Paenibacillus sp. FSL W7-1088 TaxID=2921695 RepID=UPI0030ED9ECA